MNDVDHIDNLTMNGTTRMTNIDGMRSTSVDGQERDEGNGFNEEANRHRWDGTVKVELSYAPVRYHCVSCFPCKMSQGRCEQIALHSCRLACMSLDVVRGRMPLKNLERRMTWPCINKLDTMSKLLEIQMTMDSELRNRLDRYPTVPKLIDMVFKSGTTLEAAVCVQLGWSTYWVNLVLRYQGSRWICDFADLG